MKRLLILTIAALFPLLAGAQAQINTKKIKIADFTEKTTKVVLTGNEFYDLALRNEIASSWKLSPYEFCTMAEFESMKNSDSHYFLVTADGVFRDENEPGLTFLTLVKGSPEAGAGFSGMLEIVSLPVASAEDPSGREFAFMPAFVDIIQDYTEAAMGRDINGYIGLTSNTESFKHNPNMQLVFAECDLAPHIDREFRDINFDSDMSVVDEDEADEMMVKGTPETVVSLVIAPTEPVKGSFCYKMLIHPETHKLYYFRKHKISKKYGVGFLQEDILRINKQRGR